MFYHTQQAEKNSRFFKEVTMATNPTAAVPVRGWCTTVFGKVGGKG
jgi:hypothetical protein